MWARLKKTMVVKRLYRLSQRPVLGWPIRAVKACVQHEAFQIAHLKPQNRAHNRNQASILETFEREGNP